MPRAAPPRPPRAASPSPSPSPSPGLRPALAAAAAPQAAVPHVGRTVRAYVQDALTLALENQPADPLAFLATYFRAIVQGSTPLTRACRCVHLAPRGRPAFRDNLVAAYALLANSNELLAHDYNSLIGALLCEGGEGAAGGEFEIGNGNGNGCGGGGGGGGAALRAALLVRPADAPVSFGEFAGGVEACLALRDVRAAATADPTPENLSAAEEGVADAVAGVVRAHGGQRIAAKEQRRSSTHG